MSFGGSFTGVTFFQAPTVVGANNGLSLNGTDVVLGNDQFDPAEPAQLLNTREIETGGAAVHLKWAAQNLRAIVSAPAMGLIADVGTSEAAFQIGQVSLMNDATGWARIFIGSNQPNEGLIQWLAGVISCGSSSSAQNVWQFFIPTGNMQIGDNAADNGTRLQVNGLVSMLTASDNLDFPNTAAQTSFELTIALAGAAVGDMVLLGTPATLDNDSCYTAYVSAPGVVTVRFNNYSAAAIDPAIGAFTITVIKPY